jgi:hypothetical protein
LVPYILNATLGTPPQPFRLLIDLAWDTLFVPSADCDGDCSPASQRKAPFFSNHSSTYSPLGEDAYFRYGTDRFEGPFANDKFGVAGLEITDQTFVNLESARPLGFLSFYLGYDGVLGLAPNMDISRIGDGFSRGPSPWASIVNQSLLDANMFALEVPSGLNDVRNATRHGEISFGGINDKYEASEFTRLPLSNYTDLVWVVEAQFLTWENETHPLHEDFSNYTLAGFDSTAWFIGLPNKWSRNILSSVEHECLSFDCFVSCDARASMPNISFGVGGQKITMTAFDYVLEVVSGDGEKLCLMDLLPTEDRYPVDAIVLGRPFLETFYT